MNEIEKQAKEIERLKQELELTHQFYSEIEYKLTDVHLNKGANVREVFHQLLEDYLTTVKNSSKLKFAKEMSVSQGRLYELLNGKRELNLNHLDKIRKIEGINNELFEKLEISLAEENAKKKVIKNLTINRLKSNKKSILLDEEKKGAFTSWLHYAVLMTFETDQVDITTKKICDFIDEDEEFVLEAIDRLIHFNILKKDGDLLESNLNDKTMSTKTSTKPSLESIKSLTLSQMHHNIDIYERLNLPFENNHLAGYGGFFMVGSYDRVKEAKKMYENALIKISNFLGEGKKDAIFSIAYQLTPLSNVDK